MTWLPCKDHPPPEGEPILVYMPPRGIWLAKLSGDDVLILPVSAGATHRGQRKDMTHWAQVERPPGFKGRKEDEEDAP